MSQALSPQVAPPEPFCNPTVSPAKIVATPPDVAGTPLAALLLLPEELEAQSPPDLPYQPALRPVPNFTGASAFGSIQLGAPMPSHSQWKKAFPKTHPSSCDLPMDLTRDELAIWKVLAWHQEKMRAAARALASLEDEVQRTTAAEARLVEENDSLKKELEALKERKTIHRKAKEDLSMLEPIAATEIAATEAHGDDGAAENI